MDREAIWTRDGNGHPPCAQDGAARVSISVVSHGQGALVKDVLSDLARFATQANFEVILTVNIPEQLPFQTADFPYRIVTVKNTTVKGFGENHNKAAELATGGWFCVMNPDIKLVENPFPTLMAEAQRVGGALIAPAVMSPTGELENSVRRFPTLRLLARKVLDHYDGRYMFNPRDATFSADWVAGMFMLFRTEAFRAQGGFDENFFLYYEDVDICVRFWKAGLLVFACPKALVIHDARRSSHRNLRYMRRHLSSMAQYFVKHLGRLPNVPML